MDLALHLEFQMPSQDRLQRVDWLLGVTREVQREIPVSAEMLPVVFRSPPLKLLIGLALGCALLVAGAFMIGDQSGGLLGYGFSPRLRASQAGWLVLGLGIIVATAASVGLWRGCPVLALREDGIVYTRCLQGTTRIEWPEFDRAEIERTTVPTTSGSDIHLESVWIVTRDGRRHAIAPIAPADALRDAVQKAADRWRVDQQAATAT